ncbi:MAG: anaerobic ribonucleoside-triphosphate reductase activating protein [Marinifilaceae bacterium]
MTVSSINKIAILDIVEDTVVDGPGFRTTIYCAGCPHMCPGCHNPQSWKMESGKWESVDGLFSRIKGVDFNDVTFSGGEPMLQAEAFTALAERIKTETDKSIWCYTGFRFEELLSMPAQRQLLCSVDVLVDGPYVESCKDADLLFRGSANQRLVDVQASLREQHVILWQPTNAV